MKLLALLVFAAISQAQNGPVWMHLMQPDSALTPGVTDPRVKQSTIKTTICKPGYTSSVRAVSAATKREVMQRYGLPASELKNVEIDHYFSLEVGGSNDIKNLWPQYYAPAKGQEGYLGAREKDVVETSLKRAVCSGKMTLVEAQEAIRSWPDAYRSIKAQEQK